MSRLPVISRARLDTSSLHPAIDKCSTVQLEWVTNSSVLVVFFQNKYKAKAVEAYKDYTVVLDTPTYETAKQNAVNLSDVSLTIMTIC